MEDLNNSEQGGFEVLEEQHDFFKTTEELVEWVMKFLTADHFSDGWNEEVYFTIPHIEE
ncbi:hypothetical protein [Bacillus sp. SG-1]|uniref:hypothetical protein n=1 Tax=Bacillus sp. SG-1 TaxID=161544 RepID=UPI00015447F0|nr:hypothetical protein [Bacillus sp. SG-1]EDL63294.1 hypothetical protein BSG1_08476 [Bacillus sp. SG-1]